jgi:Fur family peroxide stress response transcriptional regulator
MKISLREIERRMERFVEVCRDSDMKLTHQRMEIFREVAQTGDQKIVLRSGISLLGRTLCG